jgi:hypothetical protein
LDPIFTPILLFLASQFALTKALEVLKGEGFAHISFTVLLLLANNCKHELLQSVAEEAGAHAFFCELVMFKVYSTFLFKVNHSKNFM